ncbi:hypothetical protein EST38_g8850 [Candolleomyces aberdarensis]|uniref:Uncharacterized protein n=1 Tax=Candolleomyces aberdarensis TaxID=2316362 RepID=A0A4Q2DER4_9AGAR|nr:hypothetical protein EST38_g8850 [Candolleomyces aberdarensis]
MIFPALLLVVLTCHAYSSLAWTPASPTNSTAAAAEAGLNMTDTSALTLQWYQGGLEVSLASSAKDSPGYARGAFVHFSEEDVTAATPAVNTSWIAFIDCDRNGTGASLETDIFSLAKSKGARAACLYSHTSTTCLLNPTYRSLDPVLDIYTTRTAPSSRLIDSQFGQINLSAEPLVDYDPEAFEYHSANITATVQGTRPITPGYIFAMLETPTARNDTGTSGWAIGGGAGAQSGTGTTGSSTQSDSSTQPPSSSIQPPSPSTQPEPDSSAASSVQSSVSAVLIAVVSYALSELLLS